MASLKDDDQRFDDFSENPKSTSKFNRSLTVHNPNPTSNPGEFTKNPLLLLERTGSIKKLYNSPFVSMVSAGNSFKGKVQKLRSLFEKTPQNSPNLQLLPSSSSSSPSPKPAKSLNSDPLPFRLPGTEDRVVVYFTSLRGIRRTYTDCCAVRMIFKGFRVNLDERDISMDSAYKKELQSVLGEKTVTLPQVFIKGKYIGGADVVRQLNEVGELAKMLKGLPIRSVKPGLGYVCEGCGDVRFVPCSNCNGSRKIFDEDDEQLKRCQECNENGLVRCPECCY
ncbi:hypothetical protein ACH5RR_038085 [Cinchona calisaya]|uniref:Glutaredoxin domain-containing protein n=1 Tax=Cinchona calisaya TaxID=153742 RepID=A0ABD2YAD0_9GENT